MKWNKKCRICGCEEIGQGKLTGFAVMAPIKGNLFKTVSETIADICTACSYYIHES